MASFFGFLLMIFGVINLAWFILWALFGLIGSGSAKLSKKIGTDNEYTDGAISIAQNLKKEAVKKIAISAVLIGVGAVLYYWIGH